MTTEQELDLVVAEPPHGSVVKLRVTYPNSPRTYTYAAVGINGRWYLTGWTSGEAPTWAQLIDWLKTKKADVLDVGLATEWESLL